MGKVQIELNHDGIKQMLRSQEMMDICSGLADKALSRLGEGYAKSEYVGAGRVNVSVYAQTQAAAADNLENNSLLKAVHG